MLVTTDSLYRRKVAKIRDQMPTLKHVLLVPDEGRGRVRGRHARSRNADEERLGGLRGRADLRRRPVAAALHQRHDRHAEGRGARARRGGHALGHRPCTRSTCTRRTVFWCTADPGWVTGTSYGIIAPLLHGVTSIIDRRGVRRAPLVRTAGGRARERLVHRADRDPHADEGGRRARARARLSGAALRRQRRRAAEPRGGVVGQGGARPADPRQLVADRDRRHHDRQHARLRHQAGLDGTPLPGIDAFVVAHEESEGEPRGCASSTRPTSRASSRCAPAGRRCSAPT